MELSDWNFTFLRRSSFEDLYAKNVDVDAQGGFQSEYIKDKSKRVNNLENM